MKPVFALKALGTAVAVLALNLALTTGVIFLYAQFVRPGQTNAFYEAAAPRIAAWTAPPGGALLLLWLMAWLGRRVPARNPFAFAIATWGAYVVLDVGSGLAMSPVKEVLTPMLALSVLIALAGALAGAALARTPPLSREALT